MLDHCALVRGAIRDRQQVCASVGGRPVRLCPQALGWRGEEAYVQAVVLQERRGPGIEGGPWQWLLSWQWIRLADLAISCAVAGEWVTCPRDQRPDRDFLTQVVCEAE
jgi:hypothetical protein